MIVIAIMGILMAIAGLSYNEWMSKYRLEGQVRAMYADLMNARARAMQRNLDHSMVVTSDSYNVREDSNDDGTPDTDVLSPKLLSFPSSSAITVTLNKRGLVSPEDTITFNTGGVNAVYDCIVLAPTRIRIGRLNGTDCVSQ
jgi:Tfp pilus assembly protein FimT